MTIHDPRQEQLDAATRQRLSRLAAMPVDTSNLERRLRAEMGDPPARRAFPMPLRTWGGLIAAMLVIVATLVFTVGTPAPATAAPGEMLRLHRAMVMGDIPVTPTSDEAAVRAMVASDWDAGEGLAELPGSLLHACCLHKVGGKPVLGLLLNTDGGPITIAMADARGMKPFDGPAIVRDGRRYVVHEIDGTTMAMVRVRDRLLCFMGAVPADELVALAQRTLAGL